MTCRYKEESEIRYGRTVKRLIMENDRLVVWIEPWDGGRITRLYDKAGDCEHIWVNERTANLTRYYAANYDDTSHFGVEEAFPTVGSCEYAGALLPFFGEVWSVSWDYQILACTGREIAIRLICYSSIYPAKIVKTFMISSDGADLRTDYEIHNVGADSFDYVFGVHPSVCITPDTVMGMPVGEYDINFIHPLDLTEDRTFTWPLLGDLDLTRAGAPDDNRCVNLYSGQVQGGEYFFYNRKKNSGISIAFDHEYFQCLSVWLIYGGWRGHYCVMSEFFTSWPASVKEASEQGLAKKLPKDGVLKTSVTYTMMGEPQWNRK